MQEQKAELPEAAERMITNPCKSSYRGVDVQVRVIHDEAPPAFAPALAWSLEIQVKQPMTLMQFAVEAPYLTSWEDWQAFLQGDTDNITIHESGPRELKYHDDDILVVVHPPGAQ